jgi:putative flippase GtrA
MKLLTSNLQKVLGNKVVRFFISGGLATAIDVLVYFVSIHYIFLRPVVFIIPVSQPVASLCMSYSAGLFTNFLVSKFFVFKNSELRTRHQFMRFFLVAILVFAMNYLLMKILLVMGIYPTVCRILSAATVACVSFILHNSFTFKTKGQA